MKTRIILPMLLLCSLAFGQSGSIYGDAAAQNLHEAYTKMLEIATLEGPSGLPCLPEEYYTSMNKNFEKEDLRRATDIMNVTLYYYNPGKLEDTYELGLYKTFQDKAVVAAQNSTDFIDFLYKATGRDLGDVNKKDEETLRRYYRHYKSGNPLEYTIYIDYFKLKDGCELKISLLYSTSNYKFPNIDWNLKQILEVTCPCNESNSSDDLYFSKYEITGTSRGIYTALNKDFGTPTSAKLKVLNAACCIDSKDEDTSIELNDHLPEEEIIDMYPIKELPTQTIGGSAGVGFSNDFDETNICLGAEYLYNLADVGNSSLFVGANIMFENNSFNDFNNSIIGVGPTVQLFTPINPAKDVHMTNGISADYLFGTNDNGPVKDDISGLQFTLNTGLNVPLNENIALSLIVPIVTHTNLEFTSQDENSSFKSDATDIFFFKNSPVKIGVRIDLVD